MFLKRASFATALLRLILSSVALAPCFASSGARAGDPDALWNIVHNKCTLNPANPAPCAILDRAKGYAVLKDLVGASQYLLIATDRVSGIEDPAVLAPNAPNYFALAWSATDKVGAALHHQLPADDLSLAINSKMGRSQNQLHIHIDCVRQDVHDALAAHVADIGPSWSPFLITLAGHQYRALRVPSAGGQIDANPFALLAPVASDMASQTLVLVGVTFKDGPGFVLLNDQANLLRADFGSGEQLQDHDCAIATGAAVPTGSRP
jgi:CDP-diacylglycerol pyrophosphatase